MSKILLSHWDETTGLTPSVAYTHLPYSAQNLNVYFIKFTNYYIIIRSEHHHVQGTMPTLYIRYFM